MGVIVYVHRQVASLSLVRIRQNQRGAALVEYALLLVLIAVFCMLAVTFLGSQAADKFSRIGQSVAAT